MNASKDVTVIIPTYKRSDTLPRAIDSVLSQSDISLEIIVVDDNDENTKFRRNTEKIMEEYMLYNSNIKYIKHIKNLNGACARNTGIKASNSRYITFLDDDDEFVKSRLKTCVDIMDSLPLDWGVCYTGYLKKMDKYNQFSREIVEGDLYISAVMRTLYIGSGSNMFFRKETIDEVGMFDESFLRNQDLEYLIRTLEKFKIKHVPSVLLNIYQDSYRSSFTYEEQKRRENVFREKFKSKIDCLSTKEYRKVLKMYALDNFRVALKYKKIKDAIVILFKNKVGPILLLRYIWYIIHRIITKTSYGFKI